MLVFQGHQKIGQQVAGVADQTQLMNPHFSQSNLNAPLVSVPHTSNADPATFPPPPNFQEIESSSGQYQSFHPSSSSSKLLPLILVSVVVAVIAAFFLSSPPTLEEYASKLLQARNSKILYIQNSLKQELIGVRLASSTRKIKK